MPYWVIVSATQRTVVVHSDARFVIVRDWFNFYVLSPIIVVLVTTTVVLVDSPLDKKKIIFYEIRFSSFTFHTE